MERYDIINLLINTFDYKSYLEIGVSDSRGNFDKIEVQLKHGIDPAGSGNITHKMTSDEFFKQNTNKYDIIFVDGLHTDEQSKRDIENSLLCLSPNGTIVVHDCKPYQEDQQGPDSEDVVPTTNWWCGEVWKTWVYYRQHLPPEYEMFVIDIDTGIGIIRDTGKGIRLDAIPESELTWKNFEINCKKWLNLISLSEFRKKIK